MQNWADLRAKVFNSAPTAPPLAHPIPDLCLKILCCGGVPSQMSSPRKCLHPSVNSDTPLETWAVLGKIEGPCSPEQRGFAHIQPALAGLGHRATATGGFVAQSSESKCKIKGGRKGTEISGIAEYPAVVRVTTHFEKGPLSGEQDRPKTL